MPWSISGGGGVPTPSPVSLSRVATVAESLLAAVSPTFGPHGMSQLLVDDANRLILTDSGQDILEVRAPPPRDPRTRTPPRTPTSPERPQAPNARPVPLRSRSSALPLACPPAHPQMLSVSHPVGSFLVRAVRAHAHHTGDGATAAMAMIAAGLRRAAELCGDDDGGAASVAESRRRAGRRVRLARGLNRVARRTVPKLARDILRRAEITVRVPTRGDAGDAGDAPGDDVGWSPADRFRAAVRATTATAMCGAANPAAARKLTALTTTLAVNTILAEADRRRRSNLSNLSNRNPTAETPDDGSWARTAASTLATRGSVVAARGETVDRSVLLEGVLLSVGLRRVPGDLRRGADGRARVAALLGAELNAFTPRPDGARTRHLVTDDAAIEVRTDDQFFEMARWRAAAAARRADILARRGVNLLLCSERVDHAACDALTRRGVFVAELVREHDIRSTLAACGGGAPATAATDDALANCDVVEAEMFAEQRLPGAPAPMLYVRARGTYTALVRGPGPETSAHHKRLVERGLRVFAASLDRHQLAREDREDRDGDDANDAGVVSLIPGCAAFEAAMCARLRDAIDDARAGVVDDKSDDEYGSFDDDGVDREARAMALEVAFAMCRAVPALLARNTEAPGKTSKPTGTGTDPRGDVVRRWSDGNSVSARTRTLDRSSKLPREALDLLSRASETVRAGGSNLVGRVSAASAPEATHPGTAAAIFNRPPPPHAFGEGEPPRVAFFARALDPAEHAALEPSSATIGRMLAALAAVETAIRVGETVPASARVGTRGSAVGARGRRLGRHRGRRVGGVLVVGESSDESDEDSNSNDDDDDDGWDDDEED